jgi:hypothetical protein
MVTIRCTKKLLGRLHPDEVEVQPPTTVLGDWYGNILFCRPQLVLFMSERTLLPVVVPAAPAHAVLDRFVFALGFMLQRIGIPVEGVESELRAMAGMRVGPTRSRRAIGSLNDLMYHLSRWLEDEELKTLEDVSIRLASIPFKAIDYRYATERTKDAFDERGRMKSN